MEEYLEKVLQQIRCQKARTAIREELQAHLTDQMEANQMDGMEQEEAERAAVADMGDPVETGIALDKIHRPKVAWQMILCMTLLTAASLFFHIRMGNAATCKHIVLGFIMMLVVYHLDYTRIAQFAKPLAVLFLGSCIYAVVFGMHVAGRIWISGWPSVLGGPIQMFSYMMLYIPIYAALLYQYYGTGYKGMSKAIAWGAAALIAAFYSASMSLVIILYVSMLFLLMLAVAKGWFLVPKQKTMCLLGSIGGLLPPISILIFWISGRMAPYQLERIRNWLGVGSEMNYVQEQIKTYLSGSSFLGANAAGITGNLPDYNNSYILTYLTASYGQIVFLLICTIFVYLVFQIFSTAFRQKNQLGMMIGCGCGMILFLNMGINICENLGLLPLSQTFLPFFSKGGTSILLCYILVGLLMSVYRYKDIHSVHVNRKLPRVHVHVDVEP
mgnify:FL=1